MLMMILEHQGLLNYVLENYPGALKAFQRLRDVAEDLKDQIQEIKSYKLLAMTLQAMTEYKKAIIVLKRML